VSDKARKTAIHQIAHFFEIPYDILTDFFELCVSD
jgi:hypothetical protein